MKKKFLAFFALLPICGPSGIFANPNISDNTSGPACEKEPDGTYVYAKRDTCDLMFDIYYPEKTSETTYNGKKKPTILFLFGGGFVDGVRNKPHDVVWFNELNRNGFTVISIDYRLGMKGIKGAPGLGQVKLIDHAIHLAVEDLFSATKYIIDNEESLGIDANNIVLAGSSAGAISVLQADYELCNRTSYATALPEGFKYAGVMSFSGAVFSREGKLSYRKSAPAPTLFLHGTKDKVVTYKQITFFKLGFFGSSKLVKRFEKFGYNYNILRFDGNGHEVANAEMETLNEQFNFIYNNVMDGSRKIIDATIDNPKIEKGTNYANLKELYND